MVTFLGRAQAQTASAEAAHRASAAAAALPFVRSRPQTLPLGAAHWTQGFWADRFAICKDSTVPHLWAIYTDPYQGHALQNFELSAGMPVGPGRHNGPDSPLGPGTHVGPPFQDGDFYKLIEAMAAVYAETHDPHLDSMMDHAIAIIARAQRADGYLHTPVLIDNRLHPGHATAAPHRLDFEAYNFGHLMTAACVHYEATGKKTLLAVAQRAADYLLRYDRAHPGAMALNNICPSHYMGLVDLYRATGQRTYLDFADHLIREHGASGKGTDQNQDRIPFLTQTTAVGHAVRANYLYAGAADVCAENGDSALLHPLFPIWNDVVDHKLYVTGGCGALYDGVSPMGTAYDPALIQTVHQAYGADYQLPNRTAHNETCAAVGALLWNWQMFRLTGAARFMDLVELELYNGILPGVSLDGDRFAYTNPLRVLRASPDTLRWAGLRQPYIALSDCCPPNAARTIAEASRYAYATSDRGLWVNLYGGSILSLPGLRVEQTTDYPWNGRIVLSIDEAPSDSLSLYLRIPGWCTSGSTVTIDGSAVPVSPGTYAEFRRCWHAGDSLVLDLPMPVTLLQANPLVEEDRGQVAVKRGPLVYCLESTDAPSMLDVAVGREWTPTPVIIDGMPLLALDGGGKLSPAQAWRGLYQPIAPGSPVETPVRLIPYFAWGNRGASDMTVWMRDAR
jgi:DUF1680 family protein